MQHYAFRRARADLTEGCPEHFDWELLVFIWNFEKITRPRIEAARLALCPGVPAIRLRSNREIAAFVCRNTRCVSRAKPTLRKW